MKIKYLLMLLLLITSTVRAETASTFSGDSLYKLYAEMLYLYQTGITIHQQYDPTDQAQMESCSDEWGFITTRAKSLIGIANRIQHPDKEKFINAGWATLSCVTCRTETTMCDPIIPETIKQLRSELTKNAQ
jgi:hypothetical protein